MDVFSGMHKWSISNTFLNFCIWEFVNVNFALKHIFQDLCNIFTKGTFEVSCKVTYTLKDFLDLKDRKKRYWNGTQSNW